MTSWIAVKDKKPDKMIQAIVRNERLYMGALPAIYDPEIDVWSMNDSKYHHPIALDVTHYWPIPDEMQDPTISRRNFL